MKNINVLSLDVDGTIISLDEIPYEGVKELMMEAKENYYIIINSSRPYCAIKKIIQDYPEIDAVIYNNGCAYSINPFDNHIYITWIEVQLVNELISMLKNRGFSIRLQTSKGIIALDNRKWISDDKEYFRPYVISARYNEDMGKVMKISLFGNDIKKKYNQIRSIIPELLSIYNTKENLLEIVPNCIQKGEGMNRLINDNNLQVKTIIHIGDGINDISAFQNATVAVTFKKADEIVKKHATNIVDNPEDGALLNIARTIL